MPSPDQVRQAVHAYAAAVSSGDRDAIMDCYGDSPTLTDPYPGPTHSGRDGVSRFWDGILGMAKPYSFEPFDVVVAGDRGVFAFTVKVAIGEGDGAARMQSSGYDVLTIGDDGLIADQLAYWDPSTMRPVEDP